MADDITKVDIGGLEVESGIQSPTVEGGIRSLPLHNEKDFRPKAESLSIFDWFKILLIVKQFFSRSKETDMKPWYQSKTIWLNLVTTGLAIANVLPVNQWTIGVVAVLNIAVRLITNQPIN